jgi:predicted ATPase
MKLLSITLDGEYKGLRADTFDFSRSQGRLLAFIGLNGSGKSQLLELIAESFSYFERYKRSDFKVRRTLGFGVCLVYQINVNDDADILYYPDEMVHADNSETTLKVTVLQDGTITVQVLMRDNWHALNIDRGYFPTPYLIGYSSGLNENLQRSFMKNAVQFNDVMRTRLNYRKKLIGNINEEELIAINKKFFKDYPQLCDTPAYEQLDVIDFLTLRENVTPLPSLLFMDYDSNSLLVTSLFMLPEAELNQLLDEVKYKKPMLIKLRYNLRGDVANEDAIRDVQLLVRLAGEDNVIGEGREATDKQFELFQMKHLSGVMTFDLSSNEVKERLIDAHYRDPVAFFKRLYRLQLAGVENWESTTKIKLRDCNFKGTVKKPLKSKLPLSVERLEMADENGYCVNFDDFSDGEAQMIQILAAARIFRDEQTLFLFDEPETHLNPSWRTYFHQHLAKANQVESVWTDKTQTLLSTHSPFMISSLKKSEVYRFECDDNSCIRMTPAIEQTYGASFDVLIKQYFGLKSLISQSVINEIREKLKLPDEEALTWINENLGMSPEKAYLQRKLSKNVISS